MKIEEYAAFSTGEAGGNPAGVVIGESHPPEAEMREIAARLGHSETAFAEGAGKDWHVRYFAPDSEVPFCGHATIALGAALAGKYGSATYALRTAAGAISVEASTQGGIRATLTSAPTRQEVASDALVSKAAALFGWSKEDFTRPPVIAEAGARHLVLGLPSRATLAEMSYQFEAGQALMRDHGLVTILLMYEAPDGVVHTRNTFASGGVYEDPATGAASAALGGWFRDAALRQGAFDIHQGDDMGAPSRIHVAPLPGIGSGVQVSGTVRVLR
ncbi:PhzF family phenazine biosynthesis protein [Pontivivens insulae]|uniref:Putative isomerase YddE n=1 Tax=Pontivivens insulae TaxID=1639689 RepID=A0A2R8AE47_9RHOB|nr:PhzF family phenazine biosynthesis protein [Pontivivens insulae]RED14245.1 PhzF family phenazine biosynthesis protein [Pontivivens insulae]SPF30320.1 putative isomerase YddE [Pontivivens insulae]